jgi:hypothetical protein
MNWKEVYSFWVYVLRMLTVVTLMGIVLVGPSFLLYGLTGIEASMALFFVELVAFTSLVIGNKRAIEGTEKIGEWVFGPLLNEPR